jgi:hypothetical protein
MTDFNKEFNDCKIKIDNLRINVDKYMSDWNIYKTKIDDLNRLREEAKVNYDKAIALLLNPTRTKVFQGTNTWGGDTISCSKHCLDKKYYGIVKDWKGLLNNVNSLPHDEVWNSRPCKEYNPPGLAYYACFPYIDCYCMEPLNWSWYVANEKTFYDLYITALNNWNNYMITNQPKPPSSENITCCLNKKNCGEGSCYGIIQDCDAGLKQLGDKLSKEQIDTIEKGYIVNNNTLINEFNKIISAFNTNIDVIEGNFNDLKNTIITNNDIDAFKTKITTIYTNSTNLVNNMNFDVIKAQSSKEKALTNRNNTSPTSINFSMISSTYNILELKYNDIVLKFSIANDFQISIKSFVSRYLRDEKKIVDMKNLINFVNNIKDKINEEINKINSINNKIETIKKSIKIEDIKSIENFSKEASDIINDITNNYIKILDEKIEEIKILKNNFNSTSPYLIEANKLYNSIINTESIIKNNYNNIKNVIILIIKINDEMNYDVSIYNNLLNKKKEIDNIITNIELDYNKIEDLFNSANDFVISNKDDIIKLENIKNDALNLLNKQVESFNNIYKLNETESFNLNNNLSEKINLINDLKTESNNLFNTLSASSIFYNQTKELNNNINDIIKINNERYENIKNVTDNIENIFLQKKDKYLFDSLLNNNLSITQQPNNINYTSNIKIYIIFIIFIFIIIIIYINK